MSKPSFKELFDVILPPVLTYRRDHDGSEVMIMMMASDDEMDGGHGVVVTWMMILIIIMEVLDDDQILIVAPYDCSLKRGNGIMVNNTYVPCMMYASHSITMQWQNGEVQIERHQFGP